MYASQEQQQILSGQIVSCCSQYAYKSYTFSNDCQLIMRQNLFRQSTQSPNDLLNEFLLHLNLQQSKVNGQNTSKVNNGTLTTSHNLTHLELNRSLPSLRIDRSSPSNHTHSLMGCNYDGERRECGYPGIIPTECAAKGCCWDHSTNVGPWCFHADGRNFYNTSKLVLD